MLRITRRSILFILLSVPQLAYAENWYLLRQQMVDTITSQVIETKEYLGKAALNPEVMVVMGKVPRHEFVPPDVQYAAYYNRPLPIGYGQTISQPYIVALMTDLLALDKDDTVLEVGTGSGYQAAVLAELAREVHTIEIINELGNSARKRLKRLGYFNISVHIGDGYYGWAKNAPYDAIIVTAAGNQVPPALIRQLKPGGKMVIPVGTRFAAQQLVLIDKVTADKIEMRIVLPVSFVPLTGEH